MNAVARVLPQKLGKYEVRREVGRGGMGIVYEGFDPLIDRRVALKTFIHEFFDGTQSDNLLARLRREAQAAGRLSHPNIISVYDFGEDTTKDAAGAELNTAFIAMEFVEGRSLESYFDAHERFALPEIVRIMSELLDALEYSHQHGVVHRDIKPANIILLSNGTVKVADFGVARIESSTLTQVGTILGSPSYMSPEQFMGQTVDGRSDVYSAGVVLYELLTAEVAFTGAYTTIMHRVLNETPPPPSALNVQVPKGYDSVLQRAMAKRPDERYQTADEFKRAIVAAQQTHSVPIGAVSGTVIRPASTNSATVPPLGTAAKRAALSPIALFSSLGLLVVVMAAAGWYVWNSHLHSPSAEVTGDPSHAVNPVPGSLAATVAPPTTLREAVITAVGVANPGDPRFANDPGAAQRAVVEDARQQAVAKAAALYVEPASLYANYGLVRTKLLAHSDDFITDVIEQPTPHAGHDGMVVGTVRASVNLSEVQKALNEIAADDRVDFIRNNGDPRIAVLIKAQNPAADPSLDPIRSNVAENLLKERIRSFGFTVVDDDAAKPPADFRVIGEVRFKRLAARLPASGLEVEKFVITSWTVSAENTKTGQEIYHNTAIPQKQSWATPELALQDVGRIIGAEFTKNFFLQYFDFQPKRARLRISGLPSTSTATLLSAINTSLVVLNAAAVPGAGGDFVIDADLSGGATPLSTTIERGLLEPLNRKMGSTCFTLTGAQQNEVSIKFDVSCTPASVLNRLGNSSLAPPDAPAPVPAPGKIQT